MIDNALKGYSLLVGVGMLAVSFWFFMGANFGIEAMGIISLLVSVGHFFLLAEIFASERNPGAGKG